MANGKIYRVAVISDIHAHSMDMSATAKKDIPSWVSQSDQVATHNPLVDLIAFVETEDLSADLLLVPGDIADRADEAGMFYAWDKVQQLAQKLKTAAIIGAVGNHDLQSRDPLPPSHSSAVTMPTVPGVATSLTAPSPLPASKIRSLSPTFPLADPSQNSRHWADHVGLYEDDQVRVVTVNSCATHGLIFEGTPEYERGRFPAEVEKALKAALRSSSTKPINILVTHHHPQPITQVQFADNSTMISGDRLVRLLGQGSDGSWMIVHGHRHVPHFQLGAGDNDRPFVFSAGSLGVILHPYFYPTKPPNQFYIIEFDVEETERRANGLLGFLNAWNWNHGNGWQAAGDLDPIPERSGFGSRMTPSAVAKQIADFIRSQASGKSGLTAYAEEEVVAACPDLSFMMPSERRRLIEQLKLEGISVGHHATKRLSLIFVHDASGHNEKATPA